MKRKLFMFIIIFIISIFSLFAADKFKYREYVSDRYHVQVSPRQNVDCGNLGTCNIILVAIYDYVNDIYYYMHYIVDADWEYTYNEYKTNPDLKAHKTINLGVTNHDINQFASRIAMEVIEMKTSGTTFYIESDDGKHKLAYSKTEYDYKYLNKNNNR